VIGFWPGPLTLRQLASARRGKEESEWWHTAALRSDLANMLRGKDQPIRPPMEFHPMHRHEAKRDYDRLPKLSAKQAVRTLGLAMGLKPKET
jgi:hypothetical protein